MSAKRVLDYICTGDTVALHRPPQWTQKPYSVGSEWYSASLADGLHLRGHWSDAIRTIHRALVNGATRSAHNSFQWDLSRGCVHPWVKQIVSRPTTDKPSSPSTSRDVSSKYAWTMYLDMHLPCRQCPTCLKQRRNKWVTRMRSEMNDANRTWFGTLTLSPEEHYRAYCEGMKSLRERGVNSIKPEEELQLRHNVISKWITLWLKRVRKAGANIRYSLVMEPHKSGLPHYHILIHEPCQPVRKALLQSQWKHGFSSFKLVADDGALKTAFYVGKYLMKSHDARVRASLDYGVSAEQRSIIIGPKARPNPPRNSVTEVGLSKSPKEPQSEPPQVSTKSTERPSSTAGAESCERQSERLSNSESSSKRQCQRTAGGIPYPG